MLGRDKWKGNVIFFCDVRSEGGISRNLVIFFEGFSGVGVLEGIWF